MQTTDSQTILVVAKSGELPNAGDFVSLIMSGNMQCVCIHSKYIYPRMMSAQQLDFKLCPA